MVTERIWLDARERERRGGAMKTAIAHSAQGDQNEKRERRKKKRARRKKRVEKKKRTKILRKTML